MRRAMDETERRRNKQLQFNTDHGITARGVNKAVRELIDGIVAPARHDTLESAIAPEVLADEKSVAREIRRLEKLMTDHARNLEFEQAAAARDALNALKQRVLLAGAVQRATGAEWRGCCIAGNAAGRTEERRGGEEWGK